MHNILVVDDQPINLTLAKGFLSDEYSIIPVTSGEQALKYLETKVPDLILLDIMMPEIDGIETMKKIKENPSLDAVPIIMLSAEYDETVIEECKACGAVDFVSKPFSKPKLKEAVAKALAQ